MVLRTCSGVAARAVAHKSTSSAKPQAAAIRDRIPLPRANQPIYCPLHKYIRRGVISSWRSDAETLIPLICTVVAPLPPPPLELDGDPMPDRSSEEVSASKIPR